MKLFFSIFITNLILAQMESDPSRVWASQLGFLWIGEIIDVLDYRETQSVVLVKNLSSREVQAVAKGDKILGKYRIISLRNQGGGMLLSYEKGGIPLRQLVYKDPFPLMPTMSLGVTPPSPFPKSSFKRSFFREEGFEREEGRIQITEEYKEKIVKNLGEILMQASAEPVFKGEEIIGFLLDQIDTDSIYDKGGLQNGDIVTHINGELLDSAPAAVKMLKSLKSAKKVNLSVLRNRVEVPITLEIL